MKKNDMEICEPKIARETYKQKEKELNTYVRTYLVPMTPEFR